MLPTEDMADLKTEHGIARFNQQAFWQRKIMVLELLCHFEITYRISAKNLDFKAFDKINVRAD